MTTATVGVVLSLVSDLVGMLNESPPLELRVFVLRAGVLLWSSGALMLAWSRTTFAAVALVPALVASLVSATYLYPLVILVFLMGLLAATATRRFVIWACAVAVVWLAAFVLVFPADAPVLIVAVPLAVIALALGGAVRQHREQLALDTERIRLLEEQRRLAVEAERKSIARDLHDIVAHDITLIAMQARAAEYAGDPEAAKQALKVIGDASRDALRDLRRMLKVLHAEGAGPQHAGSPAPAPASGAKAEESASTFLLVDAAEKVAQRLRSVGIDTACEVPPEVDGLPQSIEAALYRVVQESATNVAKHAGPGATCRIVISVDDHRAKLTVRNSVGTPLRHPAGGAHYGLASMRERVEVFGGTFHAGREGGDWVVRASIPV